MVCTMEEPPVRPWSHKVGEDGLRNYINKPEGRAGRAASFLKMTNIKNRPITIIISTIIGGNINIFVIPPGLLSQIYIALDCRKLNKIITLSIHLGILCKMPMQCQEREYAREKNHLSGVVRSQINVKEIYIFIYFQLIKSNNKTNLFLSASKSSVVFAGSLDWTLAGIK